MGDVDVDHLLADIIKIKIMTKALTQKRHVNLSDYEMTTTLGTGKLGLVLLLQLSASKKSLEHFG